MQICYRSAVILYVCICYRSRYVLHVYMFIYDTFHVYCSYRVLEFLLHAAPSTFYDHYITPNIPTVCEAAMTTAREASPLGAVDDVLDDDALEYLVTAASQIDKRREYEPELAELLSWHQG